MPVWILWTIAAIALWGVWGAFSASATKHGSPLGVVAGAVVIEAIVVLPLVKSAWQARSWALVAVALFGLAAYACFFQAVKASHAAPVVVAMGATYPVVTYLISLAFFDARISWRAAVGIMLAVGGTALLSTAPSASGSTTATTPHHAASPSAAGAHRSAPPGASPDTLPGAPPDGRE